MSANWKSELNVALNGVNEGAYKGERRDERRTKVGKEAATKWTEEVQLKDVQDKAPDGGDWPINVQTRG